ncbi:hypothetical protein [Curtobacterium sp. MCBD17_040]|uniref:hypothetical protein n=1 Tax=Curtobacterium sp. MCBD17_040 TaxID=2175674 RepID=UPI000DA70DC5|nr:hypothetical protein [Curtobacterium sp. MCBD17_040]WIB65765.1 hypothetical protein DEI94_16745 [Curtobacterium sp. MCBD17_040]
MQRTAAMVVAAMASMGLLVGCSSGVHSDPAFVHGSTAPGAAATPTESASNAAEASAAAAASAAAHASSNAAAAADLASVAVKVGCTGYAKSAEAVPGAADYGTCQLRGVRVQLYWFATTADKQVFLNAVKAYGIVESQLAETPDGLTAAAAADPSMLPDLRAALAAARRQPETVVDSGPNGAERVPISGRRGTCLARKCIS